MNKTFASDLNNARLESGLTVEDCAHMMAINQTRYRNLERGGIVPTLNEICALSVLFNQAFENLYNDIFDDVKAHMSAALENLPNAFDLPDSDVNRQTSLNKLAERLQSFGIEDYGS